MADEKDEPVNVTTDGIEPLKYTLPLEENKRLKDEEIYVEVCTVQDAGKIAETMYACFPANWWDRMEPPSIREPHHPTRARRLSQRLQPTFSLPHVKWLKAIYAPTGQIVGIAGWNLPGMPVHNIWRRSAVDFYGFKEMMGWSDEDVEEMWRGVNVEAWDEHVARNDKVREEMLGGEAHWYLAPLMTWPEFQGRGVGTKLMNWAIEQADRAEPVQPMYLESQLTARNVYLRFGFQPVREAAFFRRGPVGMSAGKAV